MDVLKTLQEEAEKVDARQLRKERDRINKLIHEEHERANTLIAKACGDRWHEILRVVRQGQTEVLLGELRSKEDCQFLAKQFSPNLVVGPYNSTCSVYWKKYIPEKNPYDK